MEHISLLSLRPERLPSSLWETGHVSVSCCCHTICLLVLSFSSSTPQKKLQRTRHATFNHHPPLCKHWLCWQLTADAAAHTMHWGWSGEGGGQGNGGLISWPQPSPSQLPSTLCTPLAHLTPGRPLAPGPRAWLQPRPQGLLQSALQAADTPSQQEHPRGRSGQLNSNWG